MHYQIFDKRHVYYSLNSLNSIALLIDQRDHFNDIIIYYRTMIDFIIYPSIDKQRVDEREKKIKTRLTLGPSCRRVHRVPSSLDVQAR